VPVLGKLLHERLKLNINAGPCCKTKNVRDGKLEDVPQPEKCGGDMLAVLHVLISLKQLGDDVAQTDVEYVSELLIVLLPFLQPSVRAIRVLIAILGGSIPHALTKRMQLLLAKSLRIALRDEDQLRCIQWPDFNEANASQRHGDIYQDIFAEEHRSTSRIVGQSVRPHCYFSLGCNTDVPQNPIAAGGDVRTPQVEIETGRIFLPPADLNNFRGYTFTCWLNLEDPQRMPMPSSGRQSPGLSVPSGVDAEGGGNMLLVRLHSPAPINCVAEVYLTRCSVGGGVRKLMILTSSSESGQEWKTTKGEVMLPPNRWLLFTMSHSLPYIQRSKVTVLINGVLQFEKYQLYPQERPSPQIIGAVGGFWQRPARAAEDLDQSIPPPPQPVVSNQPSSRQSSPRSGSKVDTRASAQASASPPNPFASKTKTRTAAGRSCFGGEGFVGKVGSIVLYGEALTAELVNLLFHAGPDHTSLQVPIAVPPDTNHSWNATVGTALCEGDMVKAASKAPVIFAFDPSKACTNTFTSSHNSAPPNTRSRQAFDTSASGDGSGLGPVPSNGGGGGGSNIKSNAGQDTWQEVCVEELRLHGKLSSFPIKGPVKLPIHNNANVGHSSRMFILSDTASMDEKRVQGAAYASLDGWVRVVKYPNWPNLWHKSGGTQALITVLSHLCEFAPARVSSAHGGQHAHVVAQGNGLEEGTTSTNNTIARSTNSGGMFPPELCNLALITEMTHFLCDMLARSPTFKEDCLQCKGIYSLHSCLKQIRFSAPFRAAAAAVAVQKDPPNGEPSPSLASTRSPGAASRTPSSTSASAPLTLECTQLLHLAQATWKLIQVLGSEWFRPPRHWLGPSTTTSGADVSVGAPSQLLTQAMGCLWCDWGFWGRTPWAVQKWLLSQQMNMAFEMASTANNRLSMLIPIPALLFMLRTHFLPHHHGTTPKKVPSYHNIKGSEAASAPAAAASAGGMNEGPNSWLSNGEKIQGITLLANIIKYIFIGDLMAVCVMKELSSFEELSDVLVFNAHDRPPNKKSSAARLVSAGVGAGSSESIGLGVHLHARDSQDRDHTQDVEGGTDSHTTPSKLKASSHNGAPHEGSHGKSSSGRKRHGSGGGSVGVLGSGHQSGGGAHGEAIARIRTGVQALIVACVFSPEFKSKVTSTTACTFFPSFFPYVMPSPFLPWCPSFLPHFLLSLIPFLPSFPQARLSFFRFFFPLFFHLFLPPPLY
jgi:hypothetical protein